MPARPSELLSLLPRGEAMVGPLAGSIRAPFPQLSPWQMGTGWGRLSLKDKHPLVVPAVLDPSWRRDGQTEGDSGMFIVLMGLGQRQAGPGERSVQSTVLPSDGSGGSKTDDHRDSQPPP